MRQSDLISAVLFLRRLKSERKKTAGNMMKLKYSATKLKENYTYIEKGRLI